MLKKHIFVPLALVFAVAACTKTEVEPVATKGDPEQGRRLGSLTQVERKAFDRCISDGARAAIKDIHTSDAYRNATTTEDRNRVMMDAIQKATSNSKKICAAEFKLDPAALGIQP